MLRFVSLIYNPCLTLKYKYFSSLNEARKPILSINVSDTSALSDIECNTLYKVYNLFYCCYVIEGSLHFKVYYSYMYYYISLIQLCENRSNGSFN